MKVRDVMDMMAVDVPEGSHGDVTVERFEAKANSLEGIRQAIDGRPVTDGTFTRLLLDGHLWMSDTTQERRDHIEPALQIVGGWPGRLPAERVLIGGLGLGMILRVALLTPGVRHVDVVEIDPDVITLVGPHYEQMAAEHGVELVIHEADLFKIKWPPGTRWDVAWFDIWPDLGAGNLEGMQRLRRSYGRRAGWCDCWGRMEALRDREQWQARGMWSA